MVLTLRATLDSPVRLLGQIRSFSTSVGILLLIFGYPIGVVFDRLWDLVLTPLHHRIKSAVFRRSEKVEKIRQHVFSGDPVRANFVEYIRSRLRIARSTVCNSLMTVVAAEVVRRARWDQLWSAWLRPLEMFFGILAVISIYAFITITQTYYETLDSLESSLKRP